MSESDTREQIADEFDDASEIGSGGRGQFYSKLIDHTDTSPELSGGDVDAAWEDANVGEESVGGDNPTPDQSVVEDLGRAMGIEYQDNEPLGTEDKLNERDRWELDPASAEDYKG